VRETKRHGDYNLKEVNLKEKQGKIAEKKKNGGVLGEKEGEKEK
jgi:uncharacterized protein YifE (UPF0438 family)